MNAFTVCLSPGPIPVSELLSSLRNESCGAQVIFIGTVRDAAHGKMVEAVTYEAYLPMAKNQIEAICAEALSQFRLSGRIAVTHRLGKICLGEPSVFIGVSSAHRDEAYQASRYIIEQLKKRVPIWKQEHYQDGRSIWLGGEPLINVS